MLCTDVLMNFDFKTMNDYFIFFFSNTRTAVAASLKMADNNIKLFLQRIPKDISRLENCCTLGLVTSRHKDEIIDGLEETNFNNYTLLRIPSNDKAFEEYINVWENSL